MKKLFAVLAFAAAAVAAFGQEQAPEEEAAKPEYGYKQTGFVSTPKVGAYIIGTYKYNDREGAHDGDGFGCRLIRAYVDGTIFNDFKYRVQFQANGTKPHVKDYFLEWTRFKAFSVKIGQFKRAFTFENPMNPWDVGVGDFSMLVQKFAGMGDRLGEDNMGGRDQGIQFQGDLLPIGKDRHSLLHYQLGVYNGQGINLKDANAAKDIIGTIQVQPVAGLWLGAFGWKGTWNNGTADLKRERVSFGAKFDRANWTFRAEYAAAVDGEKAQSGESDALYITAGIPVQPWLKVYGKWDSYRDGFKSHDMYTACANFRLHKNLNFQLEYRYHADYFQAGSPNYNELMLQTYVRW